MPRSLTWLLTALVLAPAGHATAGLAEEVAVTRDFAHETARLLGDASAKPPRVVAPPATPTLVALAPPPRIAENHPPMAMPVPRLQPSRRWTAEEIDRLLAEKAARYGLNPAFVRAVVAVESAYDVAARSPKGAIGLMQLMPETAAQLGVHDPWDAEQNVEGGVRFLADLLWEFRDARAALVAYNAGPEVVRSQRAIPAETHAYVRAVLGKFSRLHKR